MATSAWDDDWDDDGRGGDDRGDDGSAGDDGSGGGGAAAAADALTGVGSMVASTASVAASYASAFLSAAGSAASSAAQAYVQQREAPYAASAAPPPPMPPSALDAVRDVFAHMAYLDWRFDVQPDFTVRLRAPPPVRGGGGVPTVHTFCLDRANIGVDALLDKAVQAVAIVREDMVRKAFTYRAKHIYAAPYDERVKVCNVCDDALDPHSVDEACRDALAHVAYGTWRFVYREATTMAAVGDGPPHTIMCCFVSVGVDNDDDYNRADTGAGGHRGCAGTLRLHSAAATAVTATAVACTNGVHAVTIGNVATVSDFVYRVFETVLTLEQRRVRAAFTYRNKAIYRHTIAVDALAATCSS